MLTSIFPIIVWTSPLKRTNFCWVQLHIGAQSGIENSCLAVPQDVNSPSLGQVNSPWKSYKPMTLAMHLEASFLKKKKTNDVMPKSICKQSCSQLGRIFALSSCAFLLSDRTQFCSPTVRNFALGPYAILLSDRTQFSSQTVARTHLCSQTAARTRDLPGYRSSDASLGDIIWVSGFRF